MPIRDIPIPILREILERMYNKPISTEMWLNLKSFLFFFSTDLSDRCKDQYYNFFQKIKRDIEKEERIWEKLDNELKLSQRLLTRHQHDHPEEKDNIRSYKSRIACLERDMANRKELRGRPLDPAWFLKKGEGLFSNSQDRFMVPFGDWILYFATNEIRCSSFKGHIDLRKVESVSIESGVLNLCEENGGRIWKLKSENEELISQWYNHFSSKIQKLKAESLCAEEIQMSLDNENNVEA